jgi:hypothetical protein
METRLPSWPGAAFALVLGTLVNACGGGAPHPGAPEAPKPDASAAPLPVAEAPPAAQSASAPEAKPETPPAEASAEPPKEPLKGRDITYRMTSSGLVIEVEGVELVPKAEAVKSQGGYDITISVKATARDGQLHRLLSPENGPLMVFVKNERGGKVTETPDTRKGDGEEFIAADDSIKLERKINSNINPGGTLTLQVGLWGLGADAAERRPVRKLFFVKMVGGVKKPTPVITAPE